jgi:hypothetical protein
MIGGFANRRDAPWPGHLPLPAPAELRSPPMPREVRNRLQKLAGDLERTMNDLIAEALDDLFTKHGERPPSR